VISRIDGVEAGVWPVGPSRKAITAAGGVAGLLLGVGLVFLFASPVSFHSGKIQHAIIPSENVATHVATSNGSFHAKGDMHDSTIAKGTTAHDAKSKFGMFHGMTLEQAIRSVQHRG
jgi:hypothetical protein